MNPDTGIFTPINDKKSGDEMTKNNWPIFEVGETFCIKGHEFRIEYIGTDCMMIQSVKVKKDELEKMMRELNKRATDLELNSSPVGATRR